MPPLRGGYDSPVRPCRRGFVFGREGRLGMTRMLRRAILVSICVSSGGADFLFGHRRCCLSPTTRADNPGDQCDSAFRGTRKASRLLHSRASRLRLKSLLRRLREVLKKPGSEKKSPVLPSFSRSTATDDVAVTEQARYVVSGEAARDSECPAVVRPKNSIVDGVRQYRLSLAREARRFKRYPDQARERGREGVVVVVVKTVAGVAIPQVKLEPVERLRSAGSGRP